MAEQPAFVDGHRHTEDCWALYAEWKRYHAVVQDMSGRFTRNRILDARHTRDMFERQLRALGCSGEAIRRAERDEEIAEHGRPLL